MIKELLIAASLSILFVGCAESQPDAVPKFQIGETVRTVVGNHEAQILSVRCKGRPKCVYRVRVDVVSKWGLGEDFFKEIELKKVRND